MVFELRTRGHCGCSGHRDDAFCTPRCRGHPPAAPLSGQQSRLAVHMSRRPLRRLRRAGGRVAFFQPIWRLTLLNRSNLRDHRKIAVFDGERVFAGGRNLANEYLGSKPDAKRWADLSFVLEGPAVAHYGEIFRYDWAFARREKLAAAAAPEAAQREGAVMQVVPSGPDVADDGLFAGI